MFKVKKLCKLCNTKEIGLLNVSKGSEVPVTFSAALGLQWRDLLQNVVKVTSNSVDRTLLMVPLWKDYMGLQKQRFWWVFWAGVWRCCWTSRDLPETWCCLPFYCFCSYCFIRNCCFAFIGVQFSYLIEESSFFFLLYFIGRWVYPWLEWRGGGGVPGVLPLAVTLCYNWPETEYCRVKD